MKKKKKSINSCYICFCLGLHVVVLQGLIAWLSDEPNHEPFFKASPNVASQNRIQCVTTKGNFEVELRPDLAPNGVQRLKEMVDIGFFDQGISFFRVNQWMTQFGADQLPQHRKDSDPYSSVRSTFPTDVHPDLIASRQRKDPKDLNQTGLVPKPPKSLSPWKRGTLALIGGTQMVVVTTPNPHMGTQIYDAPAGFVDSKGMDTVFSNLHRYNDIINNPTGDPGPKQEGIFQNGMEYITREFPQTDIIKSCSFVPKKGVL